MIALSFSFSHHGKYSSYHRLLQYLGKNDRAVDASIPQFMHRKLFNPRGWTEIIWRIYMERRAYSLARSECHEWLHYLYPEQGYHDGQALRPKGLKIAMSCHLPTDIIEKYLDYRKNFIIGLSHADAVIVMSPDDLDCYRCLAPKAKVAFIPHGIDIHYFKPSPSRELPRRDLSTILTCGGMLRDFDTLAKVIEIAASRKMPWKFRVLTTKERLEKLHSNLSEKARQHYEPLCGLSNDELLRSYQDADLLYLPLLNATANNAVLEAMACGLPMLLTDFPATRAYAGDTAEYVDPGDADRAFSQIELMVGDPNRLQIKSAEVRSRAETHLAWEVIFKQQKDFLEST